KGVVEVYEIKTSGQLTRTPHAHLEMGLRLDTLHHLPALLDEDNKGSLTAQLEQFLDFFSRAVRQTKDLSSVICVKIEELLNKKQVHSFFSDGLLLLARRTTDKSDDSDKWSFDVPPEKTLIAERTKWGWGKKKVQELLSLGEKLAESKESKETLNHGVTLFKNLMQLADEQFQTLNTTSADLQDLRKTFSTLSRNATAKKTKLKEVEERVEKLNTNCIVLYEKLVSAQKENHELSYEAAELEGLFRDLCSRPTPAPHIVPFPFADGRGPPKKRKKRIEMIAKLNEEISQYKNLITSLNDSIDWLKGYAAQLTADIAKHKIPPEEPPEPPPKVSTEAQTDDSWPIFLRPKLTSKKHKDISRGDGRPAKAHAKLPPIVKDEPSGSQEMGARTGSKLRRRSSDAGAKTQADRVKFGESMTIGSRSSSSTPEASEDSFDLSGSTSIGTLFADDDIVPPAGRPRFDPVREVLGQLEPGFLQYLERTRDDCIQIIQSFLMLGTRLSHMLDCQGARPLSKKVRYARAKLARL
ncbi:hypothetical protein BaRGS_00033772, partial [Batillaria attramentaria]